ncbi:hypothetical protein [Mesorhizobium carmichaelinearum]|uniref:hypothetical protein n=1 Tax=Mesorhizobium carmichaelinearum TaxID=1208188 RepID=UPI00117FC632|nr:hypothetical protein [Mesorhizobium carmichaelinearum]
MNQNPTLLDVQARREQLEQEIEARKLELSELAVAERVLKRLVETAASATHSAAFTAAPNAFALPPRPPVPPRPWPPVPPSPPKVDAYSVDPSKESIESLILILLGASQRVWWTANELQAELSILRGAEVPMSTISPTLTNMKNNGKIYRAGLKVADPNRVHKMPSALTLLEDDEPAQNENGEAFASPETGEPDASPNDNSA